MAVVVALAGLSFNTVYAIDPNRAMSQYVRDRWGTEQNFPKGPVYAITQTTDGYLWIGTGAGLFRFDGRSFRLIKDDTGSFTIGSVRGLVATADGSLWIRLDDKSVVRYRNGVFERPSSDTDSYISVFAMARGIHGEVLIAKSDFAPDYKQAPLAPLIFRDGKFQKLAPFSDLPQSAVISLAQVPGGDVWMGTRETGLFHFTAGKTSVVKKGLPDLKVNCLLSNGDRDLWVGTDNGIVRWSGTRFITSGIPSSLNHFQALAMAKDRDGNVWVGTDSRGLLRLNANGWASLHEVDGLSHEAVTAVYEDREGDLWIGGADHIERIRDSAFITYSMPEGMPTEGSKPVFVDFEERLWFAPVHGGLWWVKGERHGHITGDGLDRDVVYTIAGEDRKLWIGRQRGGLTELRYRDGWFETYTRTSADGLAQNSVYSVYPARDGTIWAGTLSAGVSMLKNGQFTNYSVEDGLASNTVASILEGRDGTMWFATPSGLSSLLRGRWHSYRSVDGLPSENVNCLWEDSGGALWVGTSAGIAFRSGGIFKIARGVPEVIREQILGITEDRSGSLWLATSNHVLRVNRENLLRGVLADGDIRQYGLPEGLRGVEGVKRHQSVFRDAMGRVWYSLNHGISVVEPARLTRNSVAAIVHIQAISAEGRAIPAKGAIHFPGGNERIALSFIGLSLSAPERVRYRYRLDGFDHDWSRSGAAGEATYTNLPPGSYHFRVMASNPDGVWNSNEASIDFELDRLAWQTGWFRVCGVMVFVLSILAFYRLRLHQLSKRLNFQFEERLAERIRVAHDLHDTLLQTIQGSKLVADNALTRHVDLISMRHAMERLSGWLGQAVQEGRSALKLLRGSPAQTTDLVEALRRAFEECQIERSIEFSLCVEGVSREMHPIVRDEVYRIGYEAIRNACAHSEASHVSVALSYLRDLTLRVRDNGKGIAPGVAANGKNGHFGLIGMRERASRLRGKLALSSSQGLGTEVELVVPRKIAFQQPNAIGGSRIEHIKRLF